MFGEIFHCHTRGWCYWHLVGRGEGCWEMSYDAQDSPPVANNHPIQIAISADIEKPCFGSTTRKTGPTVHINWNVTCGLWILNQTNQLKQIFMIQRNLNTAWALRNLFFRCINSISLVLIDKSSVVRNIHWSIYRWNDTISETYFKIMQLGRKQGRKVKERDRY